MIASVLILDSTTRQAIKRVSIDTEIPETLNLLSGEILSPRHDGDIGWTLTDQNEWIDPDPGTKWTPEQKIRNKRDYYLKSSDKYALPDYNISPEKKNQWSEYRQQLRDITKQAGFPNSVVWPDKPE